MRKRDETKNNTGERLELITVGGGGGGGPTFIQDQFISRGPYLFHFVEKKNAFNVFPEKNHRI